MLYGPAPATIYPRPTWAELEPALRDERDWLVSELDRAPVYCQARRFLAHIDALLARY